MYAPPHIHTYSKTLQTVWLSYDPSVFSLSFLIGLFSLLHHPLKNTGGHAAAVFSLSFLIGLFSFLHHPLKNTGGHAAAVFSLSCLIGLFSLLYTY